MSRLTNNAVDEIKSRCNIVDIIGSVVTLKKTGNNYKGLCPFHNEKTPSFVVSEPKQIFTCFGCGATGDVFEFVQKYYNLNFVEALEKLAEQYGVKIENNYENSEDKEEHYNINREAARFYYKVFRNTENPGKDYMEKRGILSDSLKKFGIGYGGDQWDGLKSYLENMGYSTDKLVKIGLVSESKGKYYDRFRNKVIFPIQNPSGKVIGFGGRAIDDSMPKYLNSPETQIFHKKNSLYGLNLTKSEIGKEGYSILVEGYMDVVSLYQSGIRNVTATLGTALTENQAKIIKRYSKNVVLAYDEDSAGQAATLRGMDILQKEGCSVKILQLSNGMDPDDFVKKKGKDAFLTLIDKALSYTDYKLEILKEKCDLKTKEGRIDFIKGAVEVLKKLSPVEADIYIKDIALKNSISEVAIRAEIEYSPKNQSVKYEKVNEEEKVNMGPIEKNLLKILLTDINFLRDIEKLDEIFENSSGKNIYEQIKRVYKGQEHLDMEKILDGLENHEREILEGIDEEVILAGNTDKVFEDCMNRLYLDKLKEEESLIISKISMADEEENIKEIEKLTDQLLSIQERMKIGIGGSKVD